MNPVVVISGLADGMGKYAAKKLSQKGWAVAGFDIDGNGIDSLKKELDESGGKHLLRPLDVTDRPGILRFRDEVLEKFGCPDTVLSNVGIGFFGPFETIDLEKALKCLEINLIGGAAVFQSFIPLMRNRKSGRLIAMSSLVGQIPFPFESIYTASKFAVEGLVESIRYEVAPFGIQVGLIEPAQVSTGFAARIHTLPPEGSPYRDRVARFIRRDNELIKHAPTPQQAAERIVNIILSKKLKFRNQIDFTSTFFLGLNRFLPKRIRDAILLHHMDI
jgi:NAD(P)-dependent dehydrogenase (short-subunit alcohol dehydrogenase family)